MLKHVPLKHYKQEVGDDLSVCVLNLFPVITTLQCLVAKILVKVGL